MDGDDCEEKDEDHVEIVRVVILLYKVGKSGTDYKEKSKSRVPLKRGTKKLWELKSVIR